MKCPSIQRQRVPPRRPLNCPLFNRIHLWCQCLCCQHAQRYRALSPTFRALGGKWRMALCGNLIALPKYGLRLNRETWPSRVSVCLWFASSRYPICINLFFWGPHVIDRLPHPGQDLVFLIGVYWQSAWRSVQIVCSVQGAARQVIKTQRRVACVGCIQHHDPGGRQATD